LDINKLIESKSKNRFGIDLLSYEDLISIVKECKLNQIKIIAIEAFIIRAEKIQPLIEKSIDFSGRSLNWDEINEYLSSVNNGGYMFEIIL
jgi:hypothetical protein